MNDELRNALCVYLGELLFKLENQYDWIENENTIVKINAINVLLDIKEKKITLMEALEDF